QCHPGSGTVREECHRPHPHHAPRPLQRRSRHRPRLLRRSRAPPRKERPRPPCWPRRGRSAPRPRCRLTRMPPRTPPPSKGEDDLLHQIVENWPRADLEPLELAEALACLREANGYSQKELAVATSKPESEISRLLSLLRLDPAVQQEARNDPQATFTRRHLV